MSHAKGGGVDEVWHCVTRGGGLKFCDITLLERDTLATYLLKKCQIAKYVTSY